MRKTLYIFLSLLILIPLKGQNELQQSLSQYYTEGVFYNPAFAGSREALCVSSIAKQSFIGFDGAPSYYGLVAHVPLMDYKLGLGIVINHDNYSTTRYTFGNESKQGFKNNGASINLAYRTPISNGTFSGGLNFGINQFATDAGFKPNDPTDPVFQNFESYQSITMGVGIFLEFEKWNLGFSVPDAFKSYAYSNDSSLAETSKNIFLVSDINLYKKENFEFGLTGLSSYSLGIHLQQGTRLKLPSVFKTFGGLRTSFYNKNENRGVTSVIGLSTYKTFMVNMQIKASDRLVTGIAYETNFGQYGSFIVNSVEIVIRWEWVNISRSSNPLKP